MVPFFYLVRNAIVCRRIVLDSAVPCPRCRNAFALRRKKRPDDRPKITRGGVHFYFALTPCVVLLDKPGNSVTLGSLDAWAFSSVG